MKSVSGMTLLFETAVRPDCSIRGNRTHQKRINDDAEGKSRNAGRHQIKVPKQKLCRRIQAARDVFVRKELDQGREDLFNDLRADEQSHGSGNAAHGTHDGSADDADT